MTSKKNLAQRLLNITKIANYRISPSFQSPNPAKPSIAPDPGNRRIFPRFLHRNSGLSLELRPPAAISILQRFQEMGIAWNRIRLDGLSPPEKQEAVAGDVRKVLRAVQIETVKSKLRKIPESCISYSEFIQMCGDDNCSDQEQAKSVAQMLDDSASVIVLGDVVFLRPEQIAQIIQSMLPQPGVKASESARKELEEMEKVKAGIDQRARTLVRRELWAGLGFLVAQTAGFMRLTFWELSWDVMEPICFYVTSMYFMAGYTFFIRTSKEPCFEGFYQSRFSSQQKRLMKRHNFDIARYNELKAAAPPAPSSEIHTSFVHPPVEQFHKSL
ncbi:unnamed protein product [Sphenostylis stenocarpa]|uniref:Calcium uniporter protein C-terminal domain-containing protein n=1 Tax=Sphenostylis stenocarpa TaxID=92480 RepID=A0AA86SK47_9FABA|nr:unnamed protein product [Sphenostylis stenocarpa]